jgi:hypothetical protein
MDRQKSDFHEGDMLPAGMLCLCLAMISSVVSLRKPQEEHERTVDAKQDLFIQ